MEHDMDDAQPAPPSTAVCTHRLVVSSPSKDGHASPGSPEVMSVLGGKASCRRKFVLQVQLTDDQVSAAAVSRPHAQTGGGRKGKSRGNPVSKDLAVTASLTYSHDCSAVKLEEGQAMVEPPLFTTFNGVEFPAHLRPSQMLAGRATFKLALSVLSSKCDNRLFAVCFTAATPLNAPTPLNPDGSPLLVAPGYSRAIRSISRKRSRNAGPGAATAGRGGGNGNASSSSASHGSAGQGGQGNHGGHGLHLASNGLQLPSKLAFLAPVHVPAGPLLFPPASALSPAPRRWRGKASHEFITSPPADVAHDLPSWRMCPSPSAPLLCPSPSSLLPSPQGPHKPRSLPPTPSLPIPSPTGGVAHSPSPRAAAAAAAMPSPSPRAFSTSAPSPTGTVGSTTAPAPAPSPSLDSSMAGSSGCHVSSEQMMSQGATWSTGATDARPAPALAPPAPLAPSPLYAPAPPPPPAPPLPASASEPPAHPPGSFSHYLTTPLVFPSSSSPSPSLLLSTPHHALPPKTLSYSQSYSACYSCPPADAYAAPSMPAPGCGVGGRGEEAAATYGEASAMIPTSQFTGQCTDQLALLYHHVPLQQIPEQAAEFLVQSEQCTWQQPLQHSVKMETDGGEEGMQEGQNHGHGHEHEGHGYGYADGEGKEGVKGCGDGHATDLQVLSLPLAHINTSLHPHHHRHQQPFHPTHHHSQHQQQQQQQLSAFLSEEAFQGSLSPFNSPLADPLFGPLMSPFSLSPGPGLPAMPLLDPFKIFAPAATATITPAAVTLAAAAAAAAAAATAAAAAVAGAGVGGSGPLGASAASFALPDSPGTQAALEQCACSPLLGGAGVGAQGGGGGGEGEGGGEEEGWTEGAREEDTGEKSSGSGAMGEGAKASNTHGATGTTPFIDSSPDKTFPAYASPPDKASPYSLPPHASSFLPAQDSPCQASNSSTPSGAHARHEGRAERAERGEGRGRRALFSGGQRQPSRLGERGRRSSERGEGSKGTSESESGEEKGAAAAAAGPGGASAHGGLSSSALTASHSMSPGGGSRARGMCAGVKGRASHLKGLTIKAPPRPSLRANQSLSAFSPYRSPRSCTISPSSRGPNLSPLPRTASPRTMSPRLLSPGMLSPLGRVLAHFGSPRGAMGAALWGEGAGAGGRAGGKEGMGMDVKGEWGKESSSL
ncbi:unnamed protein product [Closterium sp. NIES-64]|nr:unnamed protein product [Closterium sp. NIES-64]